MANTNNALGISNPNGETFVDYKTDPVGANNAFSPGITSGFKVRANDPASMTVLVGGESGIQDTALVQSTAGVMYPVGNSTGDAIEVEISGAPVTNSRIDSVVLSVDTTSTTSELNGYDLVSVDVVEGTVAATPSAPSDADIVTAIGAGKAYIVLANITVESGVVVIVDSDISPSNYAKVGAQNIDFATYRYAEHPIGIWVNGKTIYRRILEDTTGSCTATKTINHGIANVSRIIFVGGYINSADNITVPMPNYTNSSIWVGIRANLSNVYINTSGNESVANRSCIIELRYTKN